MHQDIEDRYSLFQKEFIHNFAKGMIFIVVQYGRTLSGLPQEILLKCGMILKNATEQYVTIAGLCLIICHQQFIDSLVFSNFEVPIVLCHVETIFSQDIMMEVSGNGTFQENVFLSWKDTLLLFGVLLYLMDFSSLDQEIIPSENGHLMESHNKSTKDTLGQ